MKTKFEIKIRKFRCIIRQAHLIFLNWSETVKMIDDDVTIAITSLAFIKQLEI
jgi:hypothetical protein